MNKGEINAQGTHEELLEKSKQYKSMWEAHVGTKDWSMNKYVNRVKEGVR